MNVAQFERVAKEFAHEEHKLLFQKRSDYAAGSDCLWAFKQMAELTGSTPEQVCMVLLGKHFTSISNQINRGNVTWAWSDGRAEGLKQHISDARNYLLLLAAILTEREGEDGNQRQENSQDDGVARG